MTARACALGLALATVPLACSEQGSTARAIAWLRSEQRADGMWCSSTYGVLRRGESTTAALLLALAQLPAAERDPHRAVLDRALAVLVRRRAPSPATEPETIDYPCYTAAHLLHALALLRPPEWRAESERLIAWLRARQLGSATGWPEAAREFGGFGLGDREVRNPDGGALVGLSVTSAVLEAVRAAGVDPDDPLVREAHTFVVRCQRNGDDDDDDGSFCFTPTADERASKAGFVGSGESRRAHGYGTTTADGVRALLACGEAPTSQRVVRALAWLEKHASAHVPGLEGLEDTTIEPSLRLYWCAALALVARAVPEHAHAARWREIAAAETAPMQRADGSFAGLAANMKEDDPLVATALALSVLGAVPRAR